MHKKTSYTKYNRCRIRRSPIWVLTSFLMLSIMTQAQTASATPTAPVTLVNHILKQCAEGVILGDECYYCAMTDGWEILAEGHCPSGYTITNDDPPLNCTIYLESAKNNPICFVHGTKAAATIDALTLTAVAQQPVLDLATITPTTQPIILDLPTTTPTVQQLIFDLPTMTITAQPPALDLPTVTANTQPSPSDLPATIAASYPSIVITTFKSLSALCMGFLVIVIVTGIVWAVIRRRKIL